MLYVICYMLYVICYMLYVCYVICVLCYIYVSLLLDGDKPGVDGVYEDSDLGSLDDEDDVDILDLLPPQLQAFIQNPKTQYKPRDKIPEKWMIILDKNLVNECVEKKDYGKLIVNDEWSKSAQYHVSLLISKPHLIENDEFNRNCIATRMVNKIRWLNCMNPGFDGDNIAELNSLFYSKNYR